MIWLSSAAERAHKYAHRQIPRFTETEALAVELVIGHVHPGNLGALPPSPEVLLYKAHQLGLI